MPLNKQFGIVCKSCEHLKQMLFVLLVYFHVSIGQTLIQNCMVIRGNVILHHHSFFHRSSSSLSGAVDIQERAHSTLCHEYVLYYDRHYSDQRTERHSLVRHTSECHIIITTLQYGPPFDVGGDLWPAISFDDHAVKPSRFIVCH
jgi:hypothetical protein